VGEKTWVYWVGLIIVALAIVGFAGGVFSLVLPMPRLHFRTEAIAGLAPTIMRFVALRLIGSAVFLVTGIYMMMKGKT